jgi:hypothetical protein
MALAESLQKRMHEEINWVKQTIVVKPGDRGPVSKRT